MYVETQNFAPLLYMITPISSNEVNFILLYYYIEYFDFRFQISDFRFQISDFRFQISDFKFQISDFENQNPSKIHRR